MVHIVCARLNGSTAKETSQFTVEKTLKSWHGLGVCLWFLTLNFVSLYIWTLQCRVFHFCWNRMLVSLRLISHSYRNLERPDSFCPQDSRRCEWLTISKVLLQTTALLKIISGAVKRIIRRALIWYIGSASRAGVWSEWSFWQRRCWVRFLVSLLCCTRLNICLCLLCDWQKERGRIWTFVCRCLKLNQITRNTFLACCELIFYPLWLFIVIMIHDPCIILIHTIMETTHEHKYN